MATDKDIWISASTLIKGYGEDAEIHAAMRHDELLEDGDVDGVFVLKRIIRAVREMLLEEVPEGATVH